MYLIGLKKEVTAFSQHVYCQNIHLLCDSVATSSYQHHLINMFCQNIDCSISIGQLQQGPTCVLAHSECCKRSIDAAQIHCRHIVYGLLYAGRDTIHARIKGKLGSSCPVVISANQFIFTYSSISTTSLLKCCFVIKQFQLVVYPDSLYAMQPYHAFTFSLFLAEQENVIHFY